MMRFLLLLLLLVARGGTMNVMDSMFDTPPPLPPHVDSTVATTTVEVADILNVTESAAVAITAAASRAAAAVAEKTTEIPVIQEAVTDVIATSYNTSVLTKLQLQNVARKIFDAISAKKATTKAPSPHTLRDFSVVRYNSSMSFACTCHYFNSTFPVFNTSMIKKWGVKAPLKLQTADVQSSRTHEDLKGCKILHGYFQRISLNSKVFIEVETTKGNYSSFFVIDDDCFPLLGAPNERKWYEVAVYAGVNKRDELEFGLSNIKCQSGRIVEDVKAPLTVLNVSLYSTLYQFVPQITSVNDIKYACNTSCCNKEKEDLLYVSDPHTLPSTSDDDGGVRNMCESEFNWFMAYRYMSITLGVIVIILLVVIIVGIWKYKDLKKLIRRMGAGDYYIN